MLIVVIILFIHNSLFSNIPTYNISKPINYNYLEIKKINLKQPFYEINDKNNTIEKNIEILNRTIMQLKIKRGN